MPVGRDLILQSWSQDVDAIVAGVASRAPAAPLDKGDLIDGLRRGNFQLWLVMAGTTVVALAITGISPEPGRKVCEWLVMGGRDFEEADRHRPQIERWAREQGCSAMRSFSRPGMRKRLTDYGVRGVILEKAL